MPQFISTARVGSAGTATCRIQGPPSGLQWIVYQISVDSLPNRPAGSATVKLNGAFISNTAGLPDSAQGKPWLSLDSGGFLTVDFTGLTNGDTAFTTVSYNEIPWGAMPPGDIV